MSKKTEKRLLSEEDLTFLGAFCDELVKDPDSYPATPVMLRNLRRLREIIESVDWESVGATKQPDCSQEQEKEIEALAESEARKNKCDMLTDRQKLVLTAYTGRMFVNNFSEYHAFAESQLGRPIQSHQFASQNILESKELEELGGSVVDELKDSVSVEMQKMCGWNH